MKRAVPCGLIVAGALVACRAIPDVDYLHDAPDVTDGSVAKLDPDGATVVNQDGSAPDPGDAAPPQPTCTVFATGDICCGTLTCRGANCDCTQCQASCAGQAETMCCVTTKGKKVDLACKPAGGDCK